MEISNQEDIKEQEKLDRQLLDLGPTVPLPEPEVLQPLPSLSAGGVLSRENSAEEGARLGSAVQSVYITTISSFEIQQNECFIFTLLNVFVC